MGATGGKATEVGRISRPHVAVVEVASSRLSEEELRERGAGVVKRMHEKIRARRLAPPWTPEKPDGKGDAGETGKGPLKARG